MSKAEVVKMILRLKDPDQIFDMVCTMNYMDGKYDANFPIYESRKIFKRIKDLLKKVSEK